jgi:hypothetical protein
MPRRGSDELLPAFTLGAQTAGSVLLLDIMYIIGDNARAKKRLENLGIRLVGFRGKFGGSDSVDALGGSL